jgi:uncharacterized repeat protein (TIGR03806 family)
VFHTPGFASPILRPALAPLLALFALLSPPLHAQPYGIDTRAGNTTLVINDLPPAAPGSMSLVRIYNTATFTQPTFLTEIPDGSGRLVVLEKGGRMKVFSKNNPSPTPTVMLDLSTRVVTGSEQGLLGVAFDPDFATNGDLYVHYNFNSGDPGTTRIVRFHMPDPSANTISLATEQILLTQSQPESNHKGGMLTFGPDGMLYLGLGDGGGGGDNHGATGNGQNLTTLLGKILRIDVHGTPDAGLNYRIPLDNPFAGTPPVPGTRKEIYAYGLRNPYRFSFDRVTGLLFCGDVGQDLWEEVDIITSGGNFGWRIREAMHCYNPSTNCTTAGLIDPIWEYAHNGGRSITGGYVYYGSALPELYGRYLYGDYITGEIWALTYSGGAVQSNTLLVDSSQNVSSFGQDLAGEVYVVGYGGGIYKLQPAAPVTTNFPTRLSDIPALLAAGLGQDQTAQGIIPYEPSAKLWSDGAGKERFMALPGLTQIGYRPAQGWDFPEGTVLIKNFALPLDERTPTTSAQRIETRLLYRKNSQWNGFSYEWNTAQTDAQLLPDAKSRNFVITAADGQPFSYTWQYPSRNQCTMCHTAAANGVLGLTTAQLNFDFHYPASAVTDNQLRTLDHIGLFSAPLPGPPATLPQMPDPHNAAAPLRDRARAYLAANCAMCHQPGGTSPAAIDLRWEASDSAMNAIGIPPTAGTLGIPNARIIFPHLADSSVLARMALRGAPQQMPPLATSRVDAAGLQLIRDWINSLPPPTATQTWPAYK